MITANRRDVSGRLVDSGDYTLTQPGTRPVSVTVSEDDLSDLWVHSVGGDGKHTSQRIEDLAPDVAFHRRVGDLPIDAPTVDRVDALLRDAAVCRQGLQEIESQICELLGATRGAGEEIDECVMSAVRDGIGSSIELCDLAE